MVILILGILASIVIFAILNLGSETASAACRSDFKTIESAQEVYKAQTGSYATSLGQLHGVWLKDLPGNSNEYTIAIDTTPGATYGDIMVASVNPAHAAADGNANCAYA